ncbi:MAG TPA: hypothetical protein VND64_07785 [Pirellulales bacterium]|nr:hypothetical protein [Pirellulales bacterium]
MPQVTLARFHAEGFRLAFGYHAAALAQGIEAREYLRVRDVAGDVELAFPQNPAGIALDGGHVLRHPALAREVLTVIGQVLEQWPARVLFLFARYREPFTHSVCVCLPILQLALARALVGE